MTTAPEDSVQTKPKEVVFISHAAPEDNEFSLWLASKLSLAGYRTWIDRRRLRGGDDTWDEIDRILRNDTIRQIVVFTNHVGKPGVKKELAIGEIMKKKDKDAGFIIPIRADSIAYEDAPPEFVRGNIINAFPNWHDCLEELFETLDNANIPKAASPNADVLQSIIEAREDGRRFVNNSPETLLSNWFAITPPESLRYFAFEGTQDQMHLWLADCKIPHVKMGRLAGSFSDIQSFSQSSSFNLGTPVQYDVSFQDFISGKDLGPYRRKEDASRDIPNLLRQHFDTLARSRGLLPIEFANGQIGWFFPDNLIPKNKIIFNAPDGRRINRTMSGKFKTYRWHVCLVAKPRVWPSLIYRIHINVVLSQDGKTPLSGDRTHKRRRRLTRSWWNHIWRDRLLAAVHFLGDNSDSVTLNDPERPAVLRAV